MQNHAGDGESSFCGDVWDRIDDDGTLQGDQSNVVESFRTSESYNCNECREAIEDAKAAMNNARFKQSN
ncbi:hypothetical protein [Pseudovibrio sp. POLY-S9]|uniref:hypothetical protein n=1 Tax=Pseudovibrio sp. POLY-S9 TaxID=1576596 RepID=UPI00070E1739|nr:hypothetical protein [Pseudovibrio sp. POLY-S9]